MINVGDKVVCIKSSSFTLQRDARNINLIKGKIYPVLEIVNLNCGCTIIDVGLIGSGNKAVCKHSITHTMKKVGIHYADIIRFRKVEPHTFTNEVTKELANKEVIEERIKELELEEVC